MDKNKKCLQSGLIGAVLGALTGAAVVFFADEKNRRKVKKAVIDIEGEAKNKLTELKTVVDKANKQTRKKMAVNIRNFAKQLDK